MFCMRKGPEISYANFNLRTAARLRTWFAHANVKQATHRVLESVYKAAWQEHQVYFAPGHKPLLRVREFRSQAWWENTLSISTSYHRKSFGWQHR
eukprot:1796165-Karenia_brevis.AAC.1